MMEKRKAEFKVVSLISEKEIKRKVQQWLRKFPPITMIENPSLLGF